MSKLGGALFLPLNAEHYDAFDSGTKTSEFRLYNHLWNERTCPIGREVVLSRGYGKNNRRRAVITGFQRRELSSFSSIDQATIILIYGRDARLIAEIQLELKPLPLFDREAA